MTIDKAARYFGVSDEYLRRPAVGQSGQRIRRGEPSSTCRSLPPADPGTLRQRDSGGPPVDTFPS
jgi:hypothetical protein